MRSGLEGGRYIYPDTGAGRETRSHRRITLSFIGIFLLAKLSVTAIPNPKQLP